MKKRAFTLAELLTAVLVISVIMVALAPVITKRMKESISVQTDNKKGLEIFTNPGTYTFDVPIGINTLFLQGSGGGGAGAGSTYVEKDVSFTSSTTWTIPSGVNEVTLTITGSGGGGGGSNGVANPSIYSKNNQLYNDKCLSTEFLAIRGSETEMDLCYTKKNISVSDAGAVGSEAPPNVAQGNTCTKTGFCCWAGNSTNCSGPKQGSASTGCNRPVCLYAAASHVCEIYKARNNNERGSYTLPTNDELEKVKKFFREWSSTLGSEGLQLCSHNDGRYGAEEAGVPICVIDSGCKGANMDYCIESYVWAKEKTAYGRHGTNVNTLGSAYGPDAAYSTRCVRSLNRYNRYSGAGGASGAVMEKTINVLPKDVFEVTIGSGGNGGASKTKGSQGGTTKIVHKRGGVELGTYYVKGGLGGNPATTSAHGSAYSNSTTSSGTTPSGTCYARDRKDTTDSFSGGNTSCTTLSYSGESGTSTKGGNGGRVKNTGTINDGEYSSGGYLYIDSNRTANQRATNTEISYAKGQNASIYGFGGGGGLTPAWATSASNFYGGGKGASGRVDIVYKVALPGGGGGSASRVAGVNSDNKMYEIKYKVAEGDRIVFKVGSGGTGGVEGQDRYWR